MSDTDDKLVFDRPPLPGAPLDEGDAASGTDDSDQLELVSTQMLKRILTTRNEGEREAIREAANTNTEGVLARSPGSGSFEIISEEELQAILEGYDNPPTIHRPADATLEPLKDYADDGQLSLVSTLALKKVLAGDQSAEESDAVEDEPAGYFDPYNRS